MINQDDQLKISSQFGSDSDWVRRVAMPVFIAALVIKILFCLLPSDSIDMAGYKAWSMHLTLRGFDDFYQSWHVVYAPAYLYPLWLAGELAAVFSWLGTKSHEILIKVWSIFADAVGGYLIYRIGRKWNLEKTGFWLSILYLLNPAIIMNSSVWGQFESVMTVLLLAVVYCFLAEKPVPGALLFTVAVLTKPQSALLAPLVAFLFFYRFSWRDLLLAVVGSSAMYVVIVAPFSTGRPIYWVFEHYLKSGGDYPYATANAFNLWTILGGQIVPDNQHFLGLTYALWSMVLLIGVVIFSFGPVWRNKADPFWVYYAAFLLCFGVFMVGSRMHERYLFPAIIFLTICAIRDRKLILPLWILSICHFGNTLYIYLRGWLEKPQANPILAILRQWIDQFDPGSISIWADPKDPVGLFIAWITLAVLAYCLCYPYRDLVLRLIEHWRETRQSRTVTPNEPESIDEGAQS